MIRNKKVVVVMPAYNAEQTIEKTWREVIDQDIVDLVVVVDDHSKDATAERARRLPKTMVHEHPRNRRSVTCGVGCLATALTFRLAKWGVIRSPLFGI